jgi:alpha-glucosidase (family GH31 glycosyl hydrolase)
MQELIQRWYQFGALSPIFRTHGCRKGVAPKIPSNISGLCAQGQGPNGSCGPNEVWAYGATVQPVLEKYIRLRNDVLLPYVKELAVNVSARGVVTMRALTFEFPADREAIGVDDQFMYVSHHVHAWMPIWCSNGLLPVKCVPRYVQQVAVPLHLACILVLVLLMTSGMDLKSHCCSKLSTRSLLALRLGPKFLVAPVVARGATTRRVYFPGTAASETWTDFWTNEQVPGGVWRTVAAPVETLPLYTRY